MFEFDSRVKAKGQIIYFHVNASVTGNWKLGNFLTSRVKGKKVGTCICDGVLLNY